MIYYSAVVHLSDLECGKNNRAHRKSIIDAYKKCGERLVEDVRIELIEKRRVPPARIGIAVTGDVSDTGDAEEYAKAEVLLKTISEALPIEPAHIAIVPGNHDINWVKWRSSFERQYPSFSIDKAEDREKACGLPEKLEDFARLVAAVSAYQFPLPESVVGYDGFRDLGVALIGFDTTYACTCCTGDNIGILRDDPVRKTGKEILGRYLSASPKLIPMALLHHCPDPGAERTGGDASYLHNASEVRTWLREAGFGLVLCGHEHQARSATDLRQEYGILVTGSFGLNAEKLVSRYAGSPTCVSNKYQLILIGEGGESEVVLRKLKEPGAHDREWVEDDDTGPARIPVRLRRLAANDPGSGLVRGAGLLVSRRAPLPGGRAVVSCGMSGSEAALARITSVWYWMTEDNRTLVKRPPFRWDVEIPAGSSQPIHALVSTVDAQPEELRCDIPGDNVSEALE